GSGRLPAPVDNLGELEGYHSPQVAVDVRLNTNESPYPPPAAFLEALAAAVSNSSRPATAPVSSIGKRNGTPKGEST
ncbi:MAG: hypothetical protein ACJ8CR_16140, partial [Roseiflexaceae bacterium]